LKLEEDAIPTCVIDEANILSTALQYKLRALMDDCDAMIIMTTNYPHAIDASLRNRCDVVKIDPLPPERMLPAAKKILSANGIKISDEDTLQLLGATDGTWRRALEVLEDATLALTP
jgi:DNA polymerase III delta prime subunit